MFQNRADAGEQLARLLQREGIEADIVLGIPRGGLPVAAPVAAALDAPLDVIAAKKMGAPGNEELALGAVASTGEAWYNDQLIAQLDVEDSYLEQERRHAATVAGEKLRNYRGTSDLAETTDRRVILVDDGIATGATVRACLQQLRGTGAADVVLAVPVASPSAADELSEQVDTLVVVETPDRFGAVGQFYQEFEQVSDAEARSYLFRA
ncbi:phosphoribosyltransferase [Natranaeroarchaeum aerophilus]|uniref:Phosphoribosyltransferase n=1 Tax=Natranaeroarchaeum aerophilus TaxID=2917711 RepID=A0AAE3FUZ5_9EURY|nr:phosphoribosyltransferase family protein [Natranaeroarchaeum aerophilus]MCL9815059.1 phosphoribosyltransferase [Natranaeroarchaeum aerophilus]